MGECVHFGAFKTRTDAARGSPRLWPPRTVSEGTDRQLMVVRPLAFGAREPSAASQLGEVQLAHLVHGLHRRGARRVGVREDRPGVRRQHLPPQPVSVLQPSALDSLAASTKRSQ
jgi:hypothetical protein